MNFNIIQWLFTDPVTAANTGNLATSEEPFHFYTQWLVFCIAGLLISFYYTIEGRKRFVKSNYVIKHMLDRYIGWIAIICLAGLPLIFFRAYISPTFLAWRIWRYLWLLWLIGIVGWWVYYLIRQFPHDRRSMIAYKTSESYKPRSKKKR